MARGKGRKSKPPDPHRAERLRQAREKERGAREALDRTHALARELCDRAHYDGLCREAQSRLEPMFARLQELLEKRPDVLAACGLAEFEMAHDCERLLSQVDQLNGRPVAPTLLELMEPMPGRLSAKQADALRFVAAQYAASPEAAEDTAAFRNASQLVTDCEETIAAMEREIAIVLEVARARVDRGWADAANVAHHEGQMAVHFDVAMIKGELVKSRNYVTSTQTAYEDMRKRRAALRKRLGRG